MTNATTITLLGAAGIVLFDGVAAAAARWLGLRYKWSMVGSIAIYAAVAWLVARAVPPGRPALAAAIVGVVESTLGWALAWWIGPGKSPTTERLKTQVVIAVVGSAAMAALVGWVVGWVASRG